MAVHCKGSGLHWVGAGMDARCSVCGTNWRELVPKRPKMGRVGHTMVWLGGVPAHPAVQHKTNKYQGGH